MLDGSDEPAAMEKEQAPGIDSEEADRKKVHG